MQKLIALVLVAGAAAFALSRLVNMLRRKNNAKCPHCSAGENPQTVGKTEERRN
jgi:hypothetical protein